MTPEKMTGIETKAKRWSDSNPFKKSLLSRLGGLHAAPRLADESKIQREQPRVDHARDVADALSGEGCPF